MTNPNATQLLEDGVVIGSDDEEIGRVGQVFLDNQTGRPSWVTVKTGWFGTKESFVPLDAASIADGQIRVPYDKDMIKGAPNFDAESSLSEQDEQDLYTYYGLTRGHATAGTDTDTGVNTARDDSGFVTRSEEHLQVGTERVETGTARLRKFVVTEQQSVTVPVSHEEVRVVREPIAAGETVTDAEIGEQVVEVELTEDRVRVDTEAVPVERVRLGTQTVTEQQNVTGTVRKEQIEIDNDIDTDTTVGGPDTPQR